MTQRMRSVFLLTDFGIADPFVGIVKAVVHRIAPDAPLFDLTHSIEPQNVLHAAVVLEDSVPHLPGDAVVCAVVDPGVGGARRAIAARIADRMLVAPNNGLLGPLLAPSPESVVHVIEPSDLVRPGDSATFHGRDVFAPAAALLARGEPLERLGPRIHHAKPLDFPEILTEGDALVLTVLVCDRFGNVALNLRREETAALLGWDPERAALHLEDGTVLRGLRRTYGDASRDEPLMYWNSAGRLEVAVNYGSAAARFRLAPGTPVRLVVTPTA